MTYANQGPPKGAPLNCTWTQFTRRLVRQVVGDLKWARTFRAGDCVIQFYTDLLRQNWRAYREAMKR